jgi:hypothetical protein
MAFDWIESHRGLREHPKTVTLAAVWRDRRTCVLGHLHDLWWWTLEYAPAGVIRPEFFPQVVSYCEWHGKADLFWSGLVQAGFLEAAVGTEGYAVHDWDEYAARRLARLEKDAARKRDVRAKRTGQSGGIGAENGQMSGAVGADSSCARARAPVPPDLPDPQGRSPLPDKPPTPLPTDADAQGPTGTASAPSQSQAPPPKWEEVAPGQHRGSPNGQGEVTLLKVRCPRCERSMEVAEFDEHVCELVPGDPVHAANRPGNLAGFLPRRRRHPKSAQDAAAEEQLQHMASNRPTPEEIAAEAARLGLMPVDA